MSPPSTLGELKRSGYRPRGIRDEIRENLIAALQERRALFPGIVGFDETVIPQIVNALLARHDFLLLGLRGQAKTRLIRGLTVFLDGEIPVIDGAPLNEDPFAPVSPTGKRLVREAGDDLPIAWLDREARYHEKLATPDVSIADLLGDIDPIKAMSEKLDFANEEVIHYGLVPRSNRCVFAINELPDLQTRIQVGLLNILEENDVQIRGFPIRLPLDVFMVFTANPEDYTNRGNIITPLKDRIEAQVITHYPTSLEDGVAIVKQESWVGRDSDTEMVIPEFVYELVEQTAIEARSSDYTDPSSGVSARMPITMLETIVSAMERRALLNGEERAVARICDIYSAIPAITGKIELIYKGEQEGLSRVAEHLVAKAVRERFNMQFVPHYQHGREPKHSFKEFGILTEWFERGNSVDLDDSMSEDEYRRTLGSVPGLRDKARVAFPHLGEDELFTAMEFILEGLGQNFVLSKFKLLTGTRYVDDVAMMQQEEEA